MSEPTSRLFKTLTKSFEGESWFDPDIIDSIVDVVQGCTVTDVSHETLMATETERNYAEQERDLWKARFYRLLGWVKWFRDDVCHFDKRASLRNDQGWQGLNRSVGQEDLFMASLEIEVEARGDLVAATHLASSKDEQFRSCTLKLSEGSTMSGKPIGPEGQES